MPETSIIAASIAEMTIVFPKSGSFAISSSGGKLVANIFQVVKNRHVLFGENISHYGLL